jgi:hypothetical protein
MITVLGEHTLKLDGQDVVLVELKDETTGAISFVTKYPVTRDLFPAIEPSGKAAAVLRIEEKNFNLGTTEAVIEEIAKQDPILSHYQYPERTDHLLRAVSEDSGLRASLLSSSLLKKMFLTERMFGNDLVLSHEVAFKENRLPFRLSHATQSVCGVLFIPCNIPVLVRKS